MEKRMGSLSVLFLLLVLVTSFEMQVEGRMCESQSHKFKGYCASSSNCKVVCQTEKFLTGSCRDTHFGNRRCFCEKPC